MSDARIRKLERLASLGDPQALSELEALLRRQRTIGEYWSLGSIPKKTQKLAELLEHHGIPYVIRDKRNSSLIGNKVFLSTRDTFDWGSSVEVVATAIGIENYEGAGRGIGHSEADLYKSAALALIFEMYVHGKMMSKTGKSWFECIGGGGERADVERLLAWVRDYRRQGRLGLLEPAAQKLEKKIVRYLKKSS